MIRVLHVTQKWGPGKGGVKTFIDTMLGCDAADIEQSVLSVGKVEGQKPIGQFFGPLVNSYNPFLVGTMGAKRLGSFLRKHDFDVVHIHTNNAIGFLFANAARVVGVPSRIVHCHNSSLGSGSKMKRAINDALVSRLSSAATAAWACSKMAGDYLFPSRDFEIVHNGVDLDKFRFSASARQALRDEYGISDEACVVGLVGAGLPAKNTIRALDIFLRFQGINPDALLLLIGDGEELPSARRRALELGLDHRVIFTGSVCDIWRYYSAMDIMLAPSLYEGLPIAFVEAQANGLPILSASTVSSEADITGLVWYADLSLEDEKWAGFLEERAHYRGKTSEVDYSACLDSSGYTTRSLYRQLTTAYREMAKGACHGC